VCVFSSSHRLSVFKLVFCSVVKSVFVQWYRFGEKMDGQRGEHQKAQKRSSEVIHFFYCVHIFGLHNMLTCLFFSTVAGSRRGQEDEAGRHRG
jgi:hypothetical protein